MVSVSKTQFICGCTGFIIGVIFGYSYAVLTHKPMFILPQMRAVVCTGYGGIEVEINKTLILKVKRFVSTSDSKSRTVSERERLYELYLNR